MIKTDPSIHDTLVNAIQLEWDKLKARPDLAHEITVQVANIVYQGCIDIIRLHQAKTLQSANYAGSSPERHPVEPSDSKDCTPDRQGNALIAELPAPNDSSEISDNDDFDHESARGNLKPEAWELLKKPIIQSLLYDINLLPEQITTSKHWHYMLSVLSHMAEATKPVSSYGSVASALSSSSANDAASASRDDNPSAPTPLSKDATP